jgi:hypothetical protein
MVKRTGKHGRELVRSKDAVNDPNGDEKVAYKIPMESMYTAMEFGSGHNRYDIFEYDHNTNVLTLSVMAIRPDKEYIDTIATYHLGTGVFECLSWGDIRSLKQVVTNFLMNVLGVFDVQRIEGPEGFMNKWSERMVKRNKMREMERWARK